MLASRSGSRLSERSDFAERLYRRDIFGSPVVVMLLNPMEKRENALQQSGFILLEWQSYTAVSVLLLSEIIK